LLALGTVRWFCGRLEGLLSCREVGYGAVRNDINKISAGGYGMFDDENRVHFERAAREAGGVGLPRCCLLGFHSATSWRGYSS
jgi:hypothetical protein